MLVGPVEVGEGGRAGGEEGCAGTVVEGVEGVWAAYAAEADDGTLRERGGWVGGDIVLLFLFSLLFLRERLRR